MFLIIVAVSEFGNYIGNNPKDYSCPSYCDVDHEHINIKNKEIKNELDNGELDTLRCNFLDVGEDS